jgi:hypothetical protein
MPNLHNWYKSTKKNFTEKPGIYMLNNLLPLATAKIWAHTKQGR